MVRGKKTNDLGQSPESTISGHLDDWTELAVDYLDGHLDAPSRAAVKDHLDQCPDCARRMASQQASLGLLSAIPLADAPASLESHVFARALRRRAHSRPLGPWLPAALGMAAAVALVVAVTITQVPGPLDSTQPTASVASASAEGSSQSFSDAAAAGLVATTTEESPRLATDITGEAIAQSGATLKSSGIRVQVVPQPDGPYLAAKDQMVSGLAQATAPAYFFFDTQSGALVTAEQAATIAERLTAATGLQLVDGDLSAGVRAFAAFVPREDSAALVDLLRSISTSMDLSLALSLEPGQEVAAWADTLLADKYSLAELSASPTRPPAANGWTYTTSTSPPTTAGSVISSKTAPLDEAGTHVLVVILMAVKQ